MQKDKIFYLEIQGLYTYLRQIEVLFPPRT